MQDKINQLLKYCEERQTTPPPEAEMASKIFHHNENGFSLQYCLTHSGSKLISFIHGDESATVRFNERNEFNWANKPEWENLVVKASEELSL